ncbi:MAG TPA: hypothetical protein VE954_02015 [Oligoflexus sp.]|uniref:hypothetical protein n=1 Tax=Oligoflexus sp. TaxID=1971216 RepID=UPI002D558792|nr:hypothetical protein [Oligoflexus sp.]HYX31861.1 hypothetical protein [Oligoflexus sp.]
MTQKQQGKQNSGGEPTKHAQKLHEDEAADQQFNVDVKEGQDNKRGNIGPSGQGNHRGRESRTHQSNASGGAPT